MGRIFLYVGEAGAINEAVEDALIRIGNLVADELRSRGFRVLDVPDELELTEAIAWINLIHCMGKRFWRFSDDFINRLVYCKLFWLRFSAALTATAIARCTATSFSPTITPSPAVRWAITPQTQAAANPYTPAIFSNVPHSIS